MTHQTVAIEDLSRWTPLDFSRVCVLGLMFTMLALAGLAAATSANPGHRHRPTAVGTLSTSASPGFGSVPVGSTATQTVTIRNSGSAPVNISAASASGAEFSMSGLSLPLTLSGGATASLTATFSPTTAGSVSGQIQIASNASNPSLTIPLNGTGMMPSSPLTATPTGVAFGNVAVGQSTSASVVLTNTGTSTITISQLTAPGAPYTLSGVSPNQTLSAGQSATLSLTFSPAAAGSASGQIQIASNASNPSLTIPLNGTGMVPSSLLTATPTGVAFGNVAVGQSTSASVVLTNTGTSTVTISQLTAPGAPYTLSGVSPNQTLSAGQSATLSLTFSPAAAGSASGQIQIASNASDPSLTIPLNGTGTVSSALLSASPTSVTFGDVVAGQSTSASVVLTNTGTSTVTISQLTAPSAPFTMSGVSANQALTAGQSATLTLTFSPTTTGSFTGTANIASTATNSPVSIAIAGGSHVVSLSWSASTSTVVGYNVYRGTVSGGPYTLLNPSPITGTSYTDSLVSSGQVYYYVVTAVQAGGTESVYSNQAPATVPTP